MSERVLIRLSDKRLVWESRSGASAQYENLSFSVHDNHGEYISLSHGERKAAVFPFEAFGLDGELYYYGPRPVDHAPMHPSSLTPLRPTGLIGAVRAGPLSVTQALLMTLRDLLHFLFDLVRQIESMPLHEQKLWHAFLLMSACFVPGQAIAPVPSGPLAREIADMVGTFELASRIRVEALPEAHSLKRDPTGAPLADSSTSKPATGSSSLARAASSQLQRPSPTCILDSEDFRLLTPEVSGNHLARCGSRPRTQRP